MTDYYAILSVEFVLIGTLLVALIKGLQTYFRRQFSGLKVDILRGVNENKKDSKKRFSIAFGFSSAITLQLINTSEAFKGNKVLLSLVNTAILFYLCFLSGWSRNKIIGLISRWESKPERH